jgi:exopolysaccharide production protein ExoY
MYVTTSRSKQVIPPTDRSVDDQRSRPVPTTFRQYALSFLFLWGRRPHYDISKRVMDIVISLLLLLLLCPAFLFLALAVCGADGGPVFFTHPRVGMNGRTFGCLKFRSMKLNSTHQLIELLANNRAARDEWEAFRKLRNDPRVTRVGRIMRRFSLDELPQLLNVLRGEMSLVGPRPAPQAELKDFYEPLGVAAAYLSVRPGITGLWQVSGRSNTSYQTRVALDRTYIESMSIGHDVWILTQTIGAILSRDGAC